MAKHEETTLEQGATIEHADAPQVADDPNATIPGKPHRVDPEQKPQVDAERLKAEAEAAGQPSEDDKPAKPAAKAQKGWWMSPTGKKVQVASVEHVEVPMVGKNESNYLRLHFASGRDLDILYDTTESAQAALDKFPDA